MSGNAVRLQALAAATRFQSAPPGLNFTEISTADLFGVNVFSNAVMKERLPKPIYQSLCQTIEAGERLDPSVADIVAVAMKDWAIEKGATHYAHVFYPLTGLTAEKHDTFLAPDREGNIIAQFDGRALIQGEPDASSFPSGGLRTTFEARGYTAWDVTSPAYILENPNGTTLCIPTAFVSWTGEALDKKTPLLRSLQALNRQAQRILRLFGDPEPGRVYPTVGAEQEYFLIDRNFFFARPDLIATGRTLFGAKPPKGQELADHYFGAIPERVLAFMLACERELFKLGIPVKTRHNEVAPAQYEIAPVFEEANIATDHQQLLMLTLRRVAEKYGMTCLFHEKPFAGINGSGKHVNYSLFNAKHGNLLDPGDNPHENAQFLVFCAAFIRAISLHASLLRAVVATAGNDHRLGAHEAPPAIISVYLGEELTQILRQIGRQESQTSRPRDILSVGVDTLPPLPKDAGDRNRTSPIAFTGNKFEFRAVGASQSIAGPLVAMNAILADSLDYIATELEKATAGCPERLNAAVQEMLQRLLAEHDSIIFNGDGYSAAWHQEAKRRGLPHLRTAVEALPVLTRWETVALFERQQILSRRELESRQEIYLEQYILNVQVEANAMLEISRTVILPAALRYQTELAQNCASLKAVDLDSQETRQLLAQIAELIGLLQNRQEELAALLERPAASNTLEKATYFCHRVLPAMAALRTIADQLEAIVADDLWPLPTYQEMLFIR